MRAAFYAPMKPPDHPVPSGDRRMARAFMALLQDLGYEVELASRLRSFDRGGDPGRQHRLRELGRRSAERLLACYRVRPPDQRPTLWFTYHLYHKAPDWLGPTVAQELGIPYVVAEASVAPRRANGGWSMGYAASRSAIAAADLVLAMTRKDLAGLRGVARGQLALFPPFLDTSPFVTASARRPAIRWKLAREHKLDAGRPWLLAVAMMRPDVKLLSYQLLATALARITASDWQALLVGDGPARAAIEAEFASGDPGRVRFLGALAPAPLAEIYAAADLYVWPACGEAYGMAMLEAQAAGLPVVAGNEGGVADIVADGETGILVEPRRPDAFADAIATLLADSGRRHSLGSRAQRRTIALHDTATARERLSKLLARLVRDGNAAGSGQVPCASA